MQKNKNIFESIRCAINGIMLGLKQEKNFILADQIRTELLEKGIKLIDSRDGTTYEKI